MTGYYDDTVNEVCPQCNLTCLTCINGLTCSSCDSARMRTLNSTADYAGNTNLKCPCIYKYYSPAPDQICLACHYSCAVCSAGAANNCLYCTIDAHRSLVLASSTCKCSNGFYDDGSNELCLPCDAACSICTGSSAA
jgi:proprotein convertase subtilisin/kexin type 5